MEVHLNSCSIVYTYRPDTSASVVLNDAEYRPPASAEVRGRGNVKFGAKCRVEQWLVSPQLLPAHPAPLYTLYWLLFCYRAAVTGQRARAGTLADDFIVESVLIFISPVRTGRLPWWRIVWLTYGGPKMPLSTVCVFKRDPVITPNNGLFWRC